MFCSAKNVLVLFPKSGSLSPSLSCLLAIQNSERCRVNTEDYFTVKYMYYLLKKYYAILKDIRENGAFLNLKETLYIPVFSFYISPIQMYP